jgi:hypothetical protein
MAFQDTFNRADGSLGADWTVETGSAAISGGNAVLTGSTVVVCASASESGDQDHYVVLPTSLSAGGECGIVAKYDPATGNHYWLLATASGANIAVMLGSLYNGTLYTYQTQSASWPTGDAFTLRLTYVAGTLTGYLNGTEIVTHFENTYAGQSGFGFESVSAGGQINAFDTSDTPAMSMVVTPNPLWVGGGLQQMVAEITGATWTPGVPGSSTLSVDVGAINYQYTIDATHIRFTYMPAVYIGAITFTESQYGLTDAIDVTFTPPSSNPYLLGFSAEAIAYIERSAVAESSPTIANREMIVSSSVSDATLLSSVGSIRSSVGDYTHTEGSEPAVAKLAYLLWGITNGVYAPPDQPGTAPSNTTLKQDTAALLAALSTLITSNDWTLGDVITQITGTGVPTVKDVRDDIAALGSPDYSAILTAISAVRGSGSPDLAALLTSLGGLRTGSAYTLGDVKTWIGTPAQADSGPSALELAAIIAALALAIPTGGATLDAAAVAVGGGAAGILATLVEVGAIVAELAGVAANVLTIKEALAGLPSPAEFVAPVWTDAAHATMGETVALANGLDVGGPMSGVIVVITGHPAGAGVYGFGDIRSWGHLGACAFRDSEGHYEWPISLGPENQLITPRSMQVALGARFRVGSGYTGTVTPWLASGG